MLVANFISNFSQMRCKERVATQPLLSCTYLLVWRYVKLAQWLMPTLLVIRQLTNGYSLIYRKGNQHEWEVRATSCGDVPSLEWLSHQQDSF